MNYQRKIKQRKMMINQVKRNQLYMVSCHLQLMSINNQIGYSL